MTRSADPSTVERRVVWTVAAVQLCNVLDFMMVMPLGPDFARDLGIDLAHIGLVGGSYTAAAAVSGVVGSFFLDRFDRRPALLVALLGLVGGTLLGAFATGLPSLVAARVVAGAFGGPATAISLAMVSDVVPVARRGRAMAVVMSAFSVSAVLGVPAGLELARLASWQAPFVVVAGLGFVAAIASFRALPAMRFHLDKGPPTDALAGLAALVKKPLVWLAYSGPLLTMAALFLLVPHLSAYAQYNLGVSRERLPLLYLFGGMASFACMRVAGRAVDRFGSPRVQVVATAALLVVMWIGFVDYVTGLPPEVIYVLWMASGAFSNIAGQTLISRVPRPAERARFTSLLNAVQHVASSIGAIGSSWIVVAHADHSLEGIPRVTMLTMTLLALVVPVMFAVDRLVRRQEHTDATPTVEPTAAASAE